MAARKAGQGVLLWSTGAAIAGVCWREHHTASSPWQQPTAGAPAKTLGQQSHNPLVRVNTRGNTDGSRIEFGLCRLIRQVLAPEKTTTCDAAALELWV